MDEARVERKQALLTRRDIQNVSTAQLETQQLSIAACTSLSAVSWRQNTTPQHYNTTVTELHHQPKTTSTVAVNTGNTTTNTHHLNRHVRTEGLQHYHNSNLHNRHIFRVMHLQYHYNTNNRVKDKNQ